MAKKSKIESVYIEYNYFPRHKNVDSKLYCHVHFFRKINYRHRVYEIKFSDKERLQKIIRNADYVIHDIRPWNITVRAYFENRFYYKPWFKKFTKYFMWFYYGSMWLMFAYIVYVTYIIGE